MVIRGDEHDGLCRLATKRYNWATEHGSMCADDLMQEARIAAWQAMVRYDPTRGTAFTTIAVPNIRSRARKQLEHMTYVVKLPRVLSRRAWQEGKPMTVTRAGELALERCSSGSEEQDPFRQRLSCALQALPDRLRHVIEQRFIEDRTLEDIGQELGVTRERVRQLETKALERLRELMR